MGLTYVDIKALARGAPYVEHALRPATHGMPIRTTPHKGGLVQRASGYVYRCASINSDRVAASNIHLFREPASGKSRRLSYTRAFERVAKGIEPIGYLDSYWPARPVDRDKMKWLNGEKTIGGRRITPSRSVTTKAMGAGGDLEEITSHPLIDVLRKPNMDEDGYGMMWLASMFLELTGEAYWLKVTKRDVLPDLPIGLRTAPPYMVEVVPSEIGGDTLIGGYRFGLTEPRIDLERGDMVHFRVPSPVDVIQGLGPLESGIQTADIEAAIRQAQHAVFSRGGLVDFMIVNETSKWTEDQRQQIWSQWRKKFAGVRNWFRLPFLASGGIRIEKISERPRDLLLDEADRSILRMVSVIFGVPQSMLTTEGGNKLGETSNAQQGSDDYAMNTLLPRLRRMEETMNHQLVPEFGDGLVLAFDPPMSDDQEAMARLHSEQVRNGEMTINESREEMGREPIEGGDIPRFNGTPFMSAIQPGFSAPPRELVLPDGDEQDETATDAGEAEAPMPMIDGESRREIREIVQAAESGSVRRESAIVMLEMFYSLSREEAEKLVGEESDEDDNERAPDVDQSAEFDAFSGKSVCGCGPDPECVERIRDRIAGIEAKNLGDSPFRDDYEEEFGIDVAEWIRSVARGASESVASGNAGDGISIDAEALAEILEQRLQAPVREGASAGAESASQAGFSVDFDLVQDQVLDTFLSRPDHLRARASEITARLAGQINDIVRTGVEAGMSNQRIAAQLVDSFDEIAPHRATMIARSETATAFGEGRTQAFQQTGVRRNRWRMAANACQFCRALDGKVVGVGEEFVPFGSTLTGVEGGTMVINFRRIISEPLHPQCRCITQAVVESVESEAA